MAIYFENISNDIIAGIVFILAISYIYVKYFVYTYWERHGIDFIRPTLPFGNFGPTFLQKLSHAELVQQIYNKSTAPMVGSFALFKRQLILRDPELIKAVFIKDFDYFMDRGVYIDENYDPLSGHLFSLPGQKWRNLRVKLTPVFTSGKLKAMFSTLLDCGGLLQNYIENIANEHGIIETREIVARYTTNIIASVAFGIDIDCINNPDQPFRTHGRKTFELNFRNGVRAFAMFNLPILQKLLKMKTVENDVEEFIMTVVRQTLEHREQNNVNRKDLFQLLIQLRNLGKVQNDGEWETTITKQANVKNLTINEIAAQVWLFYIAGFETSSSTSSMFLYEIAKNQQIQQKIQKEIDEIYAKHNNQLTYESINEMKYLEACIDETLRKYPIVPSLNRECTKTYKVLGTNMTIEKGVSILIPAFALQRDPKYYPMPDEFQPERFLYEKSEQKNFNEQPYMPFGVGPRNCIGIRLGKMQVKVGLISLLKNCTYHLAEDTEKNFKISPKAFLLFADQGINLRVTPRKPSSSQSQ